LICIKELTLSAKSQVATQAKRKDFVEFGKIVFDEFALLLCFATTGKTGK
jgi:hypothetical protein